MTAVHTPRRRRWPLLRLAVYVVVVALLARIVWQVEDAGWFDARAVPVSDETARAMLAEVTRWDGATSGERRGVAERVGRRLEGFTLSRVREFGFDGHRHEIAVFTHEASGLEFSLIPGGEFEMGAQPISMYGHSLELYGPRHRVRITSPFLMCRTEVTQAAYLRVMGTNPSQVKAPELPVSSLSWRDAREFCDRAALRMPSEAEWEYASRAGTTTRYWSGDEEADLARVDWYEGNVGTQRPWGQRVLGWLGRPAPEPGVRPVAVKPANPFGLHDVQGNVLEWCEDAWHDDYTGAPTDGTAWSKSGSQKRVRRGSSYSAPARFAEVAIRREGSIFRGPGGSDDGLRPARSVPEK